MWAGRFQSICILAFAAARPGNVHAGKSSFAAGGGVVRVVMVGVVRDSIEAVMASVMVKSFGDDQE
jgi:hypothetical protein